MADLIDLKDIKLPRDQQLKQNLGSRPVKKLRDADFPDAGAAVRNQTHHRPEGAVDVLLVNPPTPDGGIWIRTQHRVGRRSREEMVWPQCSLAQLAAMLHPDYTFAIVDANAERMDWQEFEQILRERAPRFYLTQVTAPTLTNDMYGVMLAKSLGAETIAFGTHVTPMPMETMRDFPALDYIVRGEPELTFRELIDVVAGKEHEQPRWIRDLLAKTDPRWESWELRQAKAEAEVEMGATMTTTVVDPAMALLDASGSAMSPEARAGDGADPVSARRLGNGIVQEPQTAPVARSNGRGNGATSAAGTGATNGTTNGTRPGTGVAGGLLPTAPPVYPVPSDDDLRRVKGLVWREDGETRINVDRPFLPDLDDLPMPLHHLLPLDKYRMPLMKGPFTFLVTSRGCPAGCKYCIKHVTYQWSVRLHSPERIMQELWLLHDLGIHNIHMYADLFTVNREQVMELCRLIIKEELPIKWTCNSRVDYVDEEMLTVMGRAGCWLISWGIESGNEMILKKAAKGADPKKAHRALAWARNAGIKNWGYFIIGLPGETEETIRETIDLAKDLPLDIALFHVAAPYPGTPFFFDVVENGWFKEGTRWEEVDMDKGTVLEYDNLSADDLLEWQRKAFREWALRPGPAWTYLKMLFSDYHTFKRALRVGMEHFSWAVGVKGE